MDVFQIRTTDAKSETWNLLGLFSKEDCVVKSLSGTMGGLSSSELKEKAFCINQCVNQAKEYYIAAESVSLLTKPLMLYYGMYSLAKALIFLSNPKVDLNELRHHGLIAPTISDNPDRIMEGKVRTHGEGVFYHLNKCVSVNHCVLKANEVGVETTTVEVPFDTLCSEPSKGQVFGLKELLTYVPELFDLFRLLSRRNPTLLKIDVDLQRNISDNLSRLMAIYKPDKGTITSESICRSFPEIIANKERFVEESDALVFERSMPHGAWTALLPKRLVQSMSQELFLLLPDKPIADINVHFAVMFLLGFVVRYKPPLWHEILATANGNMIERLLITSQSKFPHLILNEMLQKIVVFGSPLW